LEPHQRIYASARQGIRSRVASSYAARARAKRHRLFEALIAPTPQLRIVDIGCGSGGLRTYAPGLDITGVDRDPRPSYPGPFTQADLVEGLPFADGEFDLAYCSSVIEHIPDAQRERAAAEIRRVARGWWVQTPARSFPIEPHALLPFAHWLPPALRRPYWRLGVAGEWEEIELLGRARLEALLPGSAIHSERAGPLVKSWIAVRPPATETRPGHPRS
jgi:SAM-dependent methyltransferase